MSIRTPLARVRGLGTAKDGTHHWWLQRVTSVALVPLILWFVISMLSVSRADYETFQHWLSNPIRAGLMMALLLRRFTTPIWVCRLFMRIMFGQREPRSLRCWRRNSYCSCWAPFRSSPCSRLHWPDAHYQRLRFLHVHQYL
jgi:hypothetical protein